MSHLKQFLVGSVAVALAGFAQRAESATVISDNFNNATFDGQPLAGRAPSPTGPGSVYSVYTYAFSPSQTFISTSTPPGTQGDAYIFNADAAALNLTNGGASPLPSGTSALTISADIDENTLHTVAGDNTSDAGVGVGLWADTDGSTSSGTFTPGSPTGRGSGSMALGGPASSSFTGFVVSPAYGYLKLLNNGSEVASVALTAPVGGYSTFNSLSYTFNTITGAVSNVTFAGTDYTSSFSGTETGLQSANFTNSTAAGFYAREEINGSGVGILDNFGVVATPEPASLGLLGLGTIGLLARRRRA